MSHRATKFRVFAETLRQSNRSQPDWFRCSSVEEAVECWDQAWSGSRYADHVTTFKPRNRRRPFPASVGPKIWG